MKFACPNCGQHISAEDDWAGMKSSCPACGTEIVIPSVKEAEATSKPASSEYKYWAFISYSSKDKSWGSWLHRAIETYGIPAEFVKHRKTSTGHPAPKRFHPVFRDRDELPASSDLGAVIKKALSSSHYLIVICSPNAARSYWVNAEIETFLTLGRRNHILAVIVDGEPNTGDARECFPPALRRFEPIAADARRKGDGKTNAKLKLLAGMLGVDFDSLKQRDARRRRQRLTLAGIAIGLLIALMGTLLVVAVHQRQTAMSMSHLAEQRKQAIDAEAQKASTMSNLAEQRQQTAETATQTAKEEKIRSARSLYAADMLKVQSAWEEWNMSVVLELLNSQHPDYRGFEWYYWWRKSHGEFLNLTGHTNTVNSVCFSPDGKRLVSASDDKTLKLWDATSGAELHTFKTRTTPASGGYYNTELTNVYFSPDGKRLAATAKEWVTKVWDSESGEELPQLHGGNCVSFSPDNKRLVTQLGNEVILWDVKSVKKLFVIDGSCCSRFTSDGKRLASGYYNREMTIWNTENGQKLLTVSKLGSDSIKSVYFSSDGRRLASVDENNTMRLWNVENGSELFAIDVTKQGAKTNRICFSPNGDRLASGIEDKVIVWDARSGGKLCTLQGHRGAIDSICFSPDGKRLASGGKDRTVKVWDVTGGQELFSFKGHGDAVTSVCFSPDGMKLASGSKDRTIKVWDATTSKEAIPLKLGTGEVSISLDGKRVASYIEDTIQVRDVESGHQLSKPEPCS